MTSRHRLRRRPPSQPHAPADFAARWSVFNFRRHAPASPKGARPRRRLPVAAWVSAVPMGKTRVCGICVLGSSRELAEKHCRRSSKGSRGGRPMRLRHVHHWPVGTPPCRTQLGIMLTIGGIWQPVVQAFCACAHSCGSSAAGWSGPAVRPGLPLRSRPAGESCPGRTTSGVRTGYPPFRSGSPCHDDKARQCEGWPGSGFTPIRESGSQAGTGPS
jgi:hypothetical protein